MIYMYVIQNSGGITISCVIAPPPFQWLIPKTSTNELVIAIIQHHIFQHNLPTNENTNYLNPY